MYPRLRRHTKSIIVASALLVLYMTFFTFAPPVGLLSKKYRDLISLTIKLLYKRFTESDLKLDSNEQFMKLLQEHVDKKFSDDPTNKFYFLKDNYEAPTEVNIPLYYYEENAKKPIIQPYDARLTLAVYLSWIKANPGSAAPFHWSDWIDFLDLNKYILLPKDMKATCNQLFDISSFKEVITDSHVRKVSDYCKDDKLFPLGFRVTEFPDAHTRDTAKLLAKSHVYLTFPAPSKLVFLTNSKGSYHVDLHSRENDLKHSLLHNGMIEEIYAETQLKKIDVLDSYKALLKNRSPNVKEHPFDKEINLEAEWFEVDSKAVIEELKKLKKSQMDESYMESLQFSLDTKLPGKSFNEAKFLNTDGDRLLGDHHDWRFFNGLTIHTDPQVVVLHRLMKNYLQFCRVHGLLTWIAHGSLLLWYWNGMSFPWDADTDTQMPIRDLHRLGREFNQSLVIENIGHDYFGANPSDVKFNGMGAFFIDVSNSVTHRDKGNGNNNIDARFIDIQTGFYVDITGLSVSEERAPSRYDYIFELMPEKKKIAEKAGSETAKNVQKQTYNCRNRHFSSLDELSPLVMTSVQNQIGWVPKYFGMNLVDEYRLNGLVKNSFESNYYLPSMRIWAQTDTLVAYFTRKEEWVKDQKRKGAKLTREATQFERTKIQNFNAEDYSNLLHSEWILREYLVSKDFTKFHEKQIKLWLRNSMSSYYSNIHQYLQSPDANKAMWGDFFMSKVAIQGWDYDAEVASLLALIKLYDDDLDTMVLKFKEGEKKQMEKIKEDNDRRKQESDKRREEEKKKKEEEERKKKEEEGKKKDEEDKKKKEEEEKKKNGT